MDWADECSWAVQSLADFMLSVEQCRRIEPSLQNLSDEEILAILKDMYSLGQLAFDSWLVTKNEGSKNPVWVVPKNDNGVML